VRRRREMSKTIDDLKKLRDVYVAERDKAVAELRRLSELKIAYEGAIQGVDAAIGVIMQGETSEVPKDELAEKRAKKNAKAVEEN
jgi:hypothetical protein